MAVCFVSKFVGTVGVVSVDEDDSSLVRKMVRLSVPLPDSFERSGRATLALSLAQLLLDCIFVTIVDAFEECSFLFCL